MKEKQTIVNQDGTKVNQEADKIVNLGKVEGFHIGDVKTKK